MNLDMLEKALEPYNYNEFSRHARTTQLNLIHNGARELRIKYSKISNKLSFKFGNGFIFETYVGTNESQENINNVVNFAVEWSGKWYEAVKDGSVCESYLKE